MTIIENLNDAAFERMTRRRVIFESAASNGTAQETVLLPREVITKLANGEKIKGSLHAAIDGVYFTPYNIGSRGPRKPHDREPAIKDDPENPQIIVIHIVVNGDKKQVVIDLNQEDGYWFYKLLLNYLNKGGLHADA